MSGQQIIDVSHVVEDGVVTYPGLPAPAICDFLSREVSRGRYAEGVEFQIGKIEMVANTGTYVDAPFHRYADGIDLAELPLERLANLDGLVVRVAAGMREVGIAAVRDLDVRGRAVLFASGWDRHWGSESYFGNHPYLTGEAAQFLKDEGAALVGIDSVNIDAMDDLRRPVHSTLLAAGIPICEHLSGLEALPDQDFRFFAVPVKVRGMGTFPVRAYGIV